MSFNNLGITTYKGIVNCRYEWHFITSTNQYPETDFFKFVWK